MASDEVVNDMTRAILDQTKVIEKLLAVQTEMLTIVKSRSARPAANNAAPPTAQRKKAARGTEGPTLTATGMVLNAGIKMERDGVTPKLTTNGNKMWFLEIDSGFKATLFKEADYKIAANARDSRRPLIVEYTNDGQFSNVTSIKLGAAKPIDPTSPENIPESERPW